MIWLTGIRAAVGERGEKNQSGVCVCVTEERRLAKEKYERANKAGG